jgi:hypothetical protein
MYDTVGGVVMLFQLIDFVFMTLAKVFDNSVKATRDQRVRLWQESVEDFEQSSHREYYVEDYLVRVLNGSMVILYMGTEPMQVVDTFTMRELRGMFPRLFVNTEKAVPLLEDRLVWAVVGRVDLAQRVEAIEHRLYSPVYVAVDQNNIPLMIPGGKVARGSAQRCHLWSRGFAGASVVPEYLVPSEGSDEEWVGLPSLLPDETAMDDREYETLSGYACLGDSCNGCEYYGRCVHTGGGVWH